VTVAGTPAPVRALATVTAPVVRALLDEAHHKGYRHGVLGIRARPQWSGPAVFGHQNVDVTVVACVSALAAREALLARRPGAWLVILTDRPEDDLGAGVLTHLVWHRLRTPDPWDAVRTRFAATGIDPALVTNPHHRDVAVGLLAVTPSAGWPPAPGGVLTRDHAMAAVARAHLGFDAAGTDAGGVLAWSTEADVANRLADLRAMAGDRLADAVLSWAAKGACAAAEPVEHLLRAGQAHDAVPLGLVAGVLATARTVAGLRGQLAREGMVRLEPWTGRGLADAALNAWALEAEQVVHGLLAGAPDNRAIAHRALARADELLTGVQAGTVADVSDLLPHGLTRRLAALADALRTVPAPPAPVTDPDRPLVPAQVLAAVEDAWARVTGHELAETDSRVAPFEAAVRLARWLALDTTTSKPTFTALLERHRDVDAWVDSAVNDAATGVGDPGLGAGLSAVLSATRTRRKAHDRSFAAVLAVHTREDPVAGETGVLHLENLLLDVVLPLAQNTPVLLLVLDGMSVAVATKVVSGVLDRPADSWAEALLPGQPRRAAALAVLPTLTDVSRASLLCGELRTGEQEDERRGYAELTAAHRLAGAKLFHKKPLDSSRPGFAVADDVGAAIDDITRRPLVTCVLNTIDDALDRSDPGGTNWAGDAAVKHLSPLLERARNTGRIVILTSDHGHIIERRQGSQRPFPGISSGRSRPAGDGAGDGEVLVEGRRVLKHGGRAVLAVDEQLRYGPLKAGYHGGATPAEAVVPVAVLVAGGVLPDAVGLRLAPPQQPPWWDAPPPLPVVRPDSATPPNPGMYTPTLFDQDVVRDPVPVAAIEPVPVRSPLVAALLGSSTYAAQWNIAGRVSVRDDQVEALVAALLAASDNRLAPTAAATALAVPRLGLRGAVLHVQRLLNVESYPVLRIDSDGATVILDVPLMCEQFGIETKLRRSDEDRCRSRR
jgi:PglZ domain